MRNILRESNVALSNEIERLLDALREAKITIPEELRRYHDDITILCELCWQQITRNVEYLDLELDDPDFLQDILSNTQAATQKLRRLDYQASPILRARNTDRLCLKILRWLHATHPKTENVSVAFYDLEFSIWTYGKPPIYFIPPAAQHSLLYLPLSFHEYGHLLDEFYQPKRDNLIHELQAEIQEILRPAVQRNDGYTQKEESDQSVIVETWYKWAQEIFCDDVGFVMGGPSFVYALSMYSRLLARSEYYIKQEKLAYRQHPVTWIRIQLIADLAYRMGYDAVAETLQGTWDTIAREMNIVEDYSGFYDPAFLPAIQQTIDNMLIVTRPRQFQEWEISTTETELTFTSPIALVNTAWRKFLENPEDYRESKWEENAIKTVLESESF